MNQTYLTALLAVTLVLSLEMVSAQDKSKSGNPNSQRINKESKKKVHKAPPATVIDFKYNNNQNDKNKSNKNQNGRTLVPGKSDKVKAGSKNTYRSRRYRNKASVPVTSFQDTIKSDSIHTKSDPQVSVTSKKDTALIKEVIEDKGTVEELAMEIQGLLIDQTRTKAGHDFYDRLYSLWEAPPDAGNYMIIVDEKPYRVNVTMIEILVNDELLGSTVLQPRQELIEELAVSVNQALVEYLTNYKEMMKQLESEDVSGTGIY